MSADIVPTVTEGFACTVRMVTTARLRDAALSGISHTPLELDEMAEIEQATSNRQVAEERGISGLDANELVYDVAHARFINASFAYAKPREPSRFNGTDRGAWYAALAVETCIAEVTFHMTRFLAYTGSYNTSVEYAEMFCSTAGEFLDLCGAPQHPALGKEAATAYPIGNALASNSRADGLTGIIYPSVRHPGGTCIAILRPSAVLSVRQGAVYQMRWDGKPTPVITPLSGQNPG